MSRDFYVYIYKNPLKNNEPFYIGKGKGARRFDHLYNIKNTHKGNTIRKIQKETGKHPIIEIYLDNLTEEDAFSVEKNLIKFYGRKDIKTGILTNKTDGGEGTSGYMWSEEMKEKSKKWIQCRDKEGNSLRVTKDDPRWILGELIGITKNIPRSKETTEKVASKLRGRKQSPERIEKQRKAMTGKKFSQEHCESLSKVRKSLVFVKNKEGKCFKVQPDDPKLISGEYTGVSKGNSWYYHPDTKEQKCCSVQPPGFIKGKIK